MIHVELPHVNVLSKIDLVEQYGKLGIVQCTTKLVYTTLFNPLFYFMFIWKFSDLPCPPIQCCLGSVVCKINIICQDVGEDLC